FIGRVDFCWEEHRTIAEADGMAKYENPQRARDEIRRDRLLREAGHKVRHFTSAGLFRAPRRAIARLREGFAPATPYGGSSLQGEPALVCVPHPQKVQTGPRNRRDADKANRRGWCDAAVSSQSRHPA